VRFCVTSIFALLGTLTRIGLNDLACGEAKTASDTNDRLVVNCFGSTSTTTKALSDVLLTATSASNIVGCFVMGILVGCNKYWKSLSETLFVALTSGFCSCLTSYSSANYELISTVLVHNESNSYRWRTGFLVFLLNFLLLVFIYRVGGIIGVYLAYYGGNCMQKQHGWCCRCQRGDTDTIESLHDDDEQKQHGWCCRCQRGDTDTIESLHDDDDILQRRRGSHLPLGILFVLVVLAIPMIPLLVNDSKNVTSALYFTLAGAHSRIWLSNYFDRRFLATGISNVLGCLIAAIVNGILLFRKEENSGSYIFLYGVSVGFCGSLSTFSTLVKEIVEISKVPLPRAPPFTEIEVRRSIYGVLTAVVGFAAGCCGFFAYKL